MKTLLLTTLAVAISANAHALQIYDLSGHVIDWHTLGKLNIDTNANGVISDDFGNIYQYKGHYKDRHDHNKIKDCSKAKFIFTHSFEFTKQMEAQGYQIGSYDCDLQQIDNTSFDEERLNTDYSSTAYNLKQIKMNKHEVSDFLKKHLRTDANN